MKKQEHIDEATAIGEDSWELINFKQLPKRASRAKQIEALEKDKWWIDLHCGDIVRRIDCLIQEIEGA